MVLGDLAEMGYDAQWCIVSASDVGAPHKRDRCWIVANAHGEQGSKGGLPLREKRALSKLDIGTSILAYAGGEHSEKFISSGAHEKVWSESIPRPSGPSSDGARRWPAEPRMGRVVDGLTHRMDRIKALGNGRVPRVAATAYRELTRV